VRALPDVVIWISPQHTYAIYTEPEQLITGTCMSIFRGCVQLCGR